MAGLLGASHARVDAVTADTRKKKSTNHKNFRRFLDDCDLGSDPYLDTFTASDKHKLLGAFMQTVRNQAYSSSSKGYDHLVASSCSSAL
ncbi:hypothetical protein, partial [Janthinobacterium sp.]|uniref:hypothetical protein n=1 Tax=Janthinobacterium sp. TaxID=1871054 RepID=UPI00293D6AAC